VHSQAGLDGICPHGYGILLSGAGDINAGLEAGKPDRALQGIAP
jgi:hypothetical protein